MTVVMANDNPARARILHIVKDVGTQPLVNIRMVSMRIEGSEKEKEKRPVPGMPV